MIRARARSSDGRPVILLGLTRENIRRLVELGQPIHVAGESLGLGASLAAVEIIFGETEKAMYDTLRAGGAVTDETIIIGEPGPGR